MSERASNRVPGLMAVAAGFAALLFVFGLMATVPMKAAADAPNPLSVRGYIYDSVGRTVEGAEVTVAMYNGMSMVSSHTDTSDDEGYYSTLFLVTEWEIGYTIVVIAVYEGNPESAPLTTAPDSTFIDIDVQFSFEIPEFGAEWGILVAGLAVGTVGVVALVWRRK